MRTEKTYGITVSASTTGHQSTEAAKGVRYVIPKLLKIKKDQFVTLIQEPVPTP